MIGWLRRRTGPILLCAFACAGLAFAIATALPDTHTAEAVVVVPSGGNSGLSPGEASNLATTYATLIPEDRAILQNAAAKLGLGPVVVRRNLSVTHDFDTSILRLVYSDPDSTLAQRGSRVIAESIEGPKPISPRIAPRSISVVALPNSTTSKSLGPPQAAVLGFILGLIGGSLLMLAWERSDARIRDANALGAEIGCPTSSLGQASDESIVALLDRWADLGAATPLRVALLAATSSAEDDCVRAAQRLAQVGPRAQRKVARIGEPAAQTDPQILLDIGGAIGGLAAGERLVRLADLIVLVVVDGTASDDLRRALDVLEQFGSRPDWALFVDRTSGETGHPSPPSVAPTPTPQLRPDRWTPVGTVTPADVPTRRAGAAE